MTSGTIATIRPDRGDGRGFGTITPEGGGRNLIFYSRGAEDAGQALRRRLRDLFRRGAKGTPPFDRLIVGQRVTFVLGADGTQAGRACAEHVRPHLVPPAVP